MICWYPKTRFASEDFNNITSEIFASSAPHIVSNPFKMNQAVTNKGNINITIISTNSYWTDWISRQNTIWMNQIITETSHIASSDSEVIQTAWSEAIDGEMTLFESCIINWSPFTTNFAHFKIITSDWCTAIAMWCSPTKFYTCAGNISKTISATDLEISQFIAGIPDGNIDSSLNDDGFGWFGES